MRDLHWILILVIACLVALALLAPLASSAPIATTRPTPVAVIEAPLGNVSEARDIGQMDTVYWNETINVELVMGWEMKLIHADTGKVVSVENYPDRVYIDREVFLEGQWDQWYPTEDNHGNTVAFYVEKYRPNATPGVYGNNTTQVNTTANVTPKKSYDIEDRHIADVLIAQGDPFIHNVSESGYLDPTMDTKIWIFGDRDMLLDVKVEKGIFSLSPAQTQRLGEGLHQLIMQQAGPNTIVEANAVYEPPVTLYIESPFKGTPNLDIGGSPSNPQKVPPIIYTEFKNWLETNTDDDVLILELVVQAPSVEITAIDEIVKENTTIWLVRGYTNLANGTPVYGILDEGQQTSRTIRQNTFHSTATGTDPGGMRKFSVAIPIDYNNTPVGDHFVTVRASEDVYSIVPRWIYNIPEGQEKPVLQTKYSGGNLFVATPTPEIIKVPEPYEVVKTVYVTITPEPTPTPVPTPWYFESPWFYLEIILAVVITVVAGLWTMWKLGMI